MSPTSRLSDLRALAFFAGLPRPALRRFATASVERRLEPGTLLVRQQEEASRLFVLLSGSASVLVRVEGDDRAVPGPWLVDGALVGWAVFLPPYRHAVSVRCETPCRVLGLSRDVFAAAFADDPGLEYEVLARVTSAVTDELAHAAGLPGVS